MKTWQASKQRKSIGTLHKTKGGTTLPLEQKVFDTIERFALIQKGEMLVVGVSGGPDSMALLYLLNSLKSRLGIELVIAHLNHGWRKKEAARDQKFVEGQSKRLGISFESEMLVKHKATDKLPSEAYWRECRWNFFKCVAQKYGATTIALAHHQSDQAETVLMRLLRGAGTLGLGAMRLTSFREQVKVIRPLLYVSREEIHAYLKRRRIKFVEDSSNRSPLFLRNRVRLELLPFLESSFQVHIRRLLAQTAENLGEDEEYLGQLTEKVWGQTLVKECDAYAVLNLARLRAEHPAIQFRVLKKAAHNLDTSAELDFDHWQKIRLLIEGRNIRSVTLPGKLEIRREHGELFIRHGNLAAKSLAVPFTQSLEIGAQCQLPESDIKIGLRSIGGDEVNRTDILKPHDRWQEIFDRDSVRLPLLVRPRKVGDRFHPLGQSKAMKLKDFFIREKLPSYRRCNWPLVVSGEEVIWVTGYRLSEKVKVTPKTARFLKISAER